MKSKLLAFSMVFLITGTLFSQSLISLYHEANRVNNSVVSDHYLLIGEPVDDLNSREITGLVLKTINQWGHGITNIFSNWKEGFFGLKVWLNPNYRNQPFTKYIKKTRNDLDNLNAYIVKLTDNLAGYTGSDRHFDGCVSLKEDFDEACKSKLAINNTITNLKKIEKRLLAHEEYRREVKLYQ